LFPRTCSSSVGKSAIFLRMAIIRDSENVLQAAWLLRDFRKLPVKRLDSFYSAQFFMFSGIRFKLAYRYSSVCSGFVFSLETADDSSNAVLSSNLPEFVTIAFGRKRKDFVQSSPGIWRSVVFEFDPFVYSKIWKKVKNFIQKDRLPVIRLVMVK
jgi:hypothetical protein